MLGSEPPFIDTETTNLMQDKHKFGYNTISGNDDSSSQSSLTSIEKRERLMIEQGSLLPDGISKMPGVYYNFMNSLVGAGILGLPFVYPSAGLFGGILLQFIFASLSVYTLNIVIKSAQIVHVHDYEELGYKCFGNIGYVWVVSCLFLQDFGTMLNYLIIIGDSSFKIIQIWGYDTFEYRQFILLFVALIIIFPPCLLRDIAFYEKFSFIKLITIIMVVSLIIYEYISYRILETQSYKVTPHKYYPISSELTFFNLAGFAKAVGIVAYTFEVHDAAFLYYNTLWNPTISRWNKLSTISMISGLILGLGLSVPAYLIFGNKICSNVLNSFDVNSVFIIIARIIYAITMALSYPTSFFVVRHVIYMSYQKVLFSIQQYRIQKRWENKQKRIMKIQRDNNNDMEQNTNDGGNGGNIILTDDGIELLNKKTFEESSFTIKTSPLMHHGLFTIGLFCCNISLALYINDLGIALNVVGSIASVNLIFILPAICYWKCCGFDYKFWKYKTWREQLEAFNAVYGSICLVILGSAIAVIGISSVF